MISRTISIIVANWWFYLFFAAVKLVLVGLVEAGYFKSGSNITSVMLWLIFARFIHRSALFGIRLSEPRPDGVADQFNGGFVLKGVVLLAVSLVLAVPVLFWTMSPKLTASAAPDVGDVYPFLVALLVTYSLVLSLAGSWLPASVYRQNIGLGAALRRGSRTFLPALLWVAPTLLLTTIIEFALLFAAVLFHLDPAVVRNGVINAPAALFALAVILAQSFSISMISVVLSHFYLTAEGVEEPVLKG